jgi:predicted transcriptional regulator
MQKELTLRRGTVAKLAKLCDCTEQTVRNAIRGVTIEGDSERIRQTAVKYGYAVKQIPLTIEEYERRYRL